MLLIAAANPAIAEEICQHAARELGLACAPAQAGQPADLTLSEQDAPYRLHDVLARLSGLATNAKEQIEFSGFFFNPRQRRLGFADAGCDVTDKEAALLLALYEAKGQPVAKDALLKGIWGIEAALDTHTLETHIYRLRGKIRDISGSDTIIEASEGGYRLAL